MQVDTLKKRYFFKLSSNIVLLLFNIFSAGIIPRSLGPGSYGNFSFLTNFFSQLTGFFNTGTSIAFYTKLSQRPKEYGLLRFYWMIICLACLMVILFVGLVILLKKDQFFFPDQLVKYIWMASIWAIMMWVSQILGNIIDAYGLTVKGETSKIKQKVLGTLILLCMFWLDWFNLTEFFIYHYIIIVYLYFALWSLLKKNQIPLFPEKNLGKTEFKKYVKEFYSYSSPLFGFAFVSFAAGIFNRWFLQKVAGSVEQGFFGLSLKIGTICLLFTSGFTDLILREFSIDFDKNNITRMRHLFKKYLPLFYSISVYFAVFISLQAKKVCLILGGEQYRNASFAIAIMAYYPVFQTIGQLSGSVFYATGQTRLYRNIGISMMLTGAIASYFFLAPNQYYGLNLGSTGLSLKMIIFAFISVNIQLWFNCKLLKISIFYFIKHQVLTILILWTTAFSIVTVVDLMMTERIVVAFLVSGLIYTLVVLCIIYFMPSLFALNKHELKNLVSTVIDKMRI